MKRGFLFSILLATSSSAMAFEKDLPICFFPGAGGGNPDSMVNFRNTLVARGIRYVPFELGRVGSVMDRAQKLKTLLTRILEKNPSFRCHVFAYSMGGPVARYSYHHLSATLADGREIPFKNVFASISTFSSPHRGTPLAEWLQRYSAKYTAGMDDLKASDMAKYWDPSKPETYSPEPTEIPSYSYLSFITKREQGDDFLAKFGFQLIHQIHGPRGEDTLSDGIVPTASQPFGQPLGKLNVSHGFFSYEIGLRPSAPDFFEVHWHFLNGDRPAPDAEARIQNTLSSSLISGTQMLKTVFGF